MISQLSGKLIKNGMTYAVIECGGIGYYVNIPQTVGNSLPPEGELCKLQVIMNISKTDISQSDSQMQERQCFQFLTSVSGAGTKAGLEILGALSVEEIYHAVFTESPDVFSQVKGVGKKLSQRIVLELKDKVESNAENMMLSNTEIQQNGNAWTSAIEALVSLGYQRREAIKAVSQIDKSLTVEQIISQALRKLMQHRTDPIGRKLSIMKKAGRTRAKTGFGVKS